MHAYRTHTCGALRLSDAGSTVRVSGWIHRKRDHGGLMFIDLRDHYGLTQLVLSPETPGFATAERNLLPLSGQRKPDVRIFEAEPCQVLGEEMRNQNGRCAEREPTDKRSVGGLRQSGDAISRSLHLKGPLEHLLADRGEAAGAWQAIHKPHV